MTAVQLACRHSHVDHGRVVRPGHVDGVGQPDPVPIDVTAVVPATASYSSSTGWKDELANRNVSTRSARPAALNVTVALRRWVKKDLWTWIDTLS